MLNLLKNLHDRAEEIKGSKLIILLATIFVVFLLIGLSSNYFIDEILKSTEFSNEIVSNSNSEENLLSYEGIITFVDARNYPLDNISFYLATARGKQIILLTASDKKLEVAEGLFATVYGSLSKTQDGKSDVLVVERVAVSNK